MSKKRVAADTADIDEHELKRYKHAEVSEPEKSSEIPAELHVMALDMWGEVFGVHVRQRL